MAADALAAVDGGCAVAGPGGAGGKGQGAAPCAVLRSTYASKVSVYCNVLTRSLATVRTPQSAGAAACRAAGARIVTRV